MKFKTSIVELKKALQVLSPIVNHTHPVLAFRYLLIRQYNDQIEFKAYDDYTVGSAFVNVYDTEGEGTGAFVSAKQFIGLVNSFAGDEILINITEKRCKVSCGKSSYSLNLLDREVAEKSLAKMEIDYYQDFDGHKINIEDFVMAYSSVSHCLSKDNSQRNLQNVFLIDGKMVACDGVRGAIVQFDAGIDNVMVHKTLCSCISGAKAAEMKIEVIDGKLFGATANFRFATVVSEDYPYESISTIIDSFDCDKRPKEIVEISSDEVCDKLSRILMFADMETFAVKFEFSDKVKMSIDGGVAEETVEICKIAEGAESQVVVDGKNLREAFMKTTLDTSWFSNSPTDVQYIYDGSLLQFFLGLSE